MGDDAPRGHGSGSGRRWSAGVGSSTLTPPDGLPALDDAPRRVVPPAPPRRPAAVDPCVCGHGKDAHEHWRRGSDCGACGSERCARYRRPGGVVRRFLRRVVGR